MTARRTRGTLAVTLAAGLLLSAAACSDGNEAASPGGSEPGGALSGEIRFQTWNLMNDTFTPYFNDLIAEFEGANPGTSIEWVDQPAEGYQDALSADAAAGSLPDVVDMGPEAAYTLAQAGIAENIAETDPGAQELYLDQAWEAMTFPGLENGTYGYPWYLNTGPSFFNGELFSECGLDPENPPTDYDSLFEQAAVMGRECPEDAMLARLPAIENFGEYGVEIMNAEGTEFTYNSPRGVELVQRFVDLYAEAGLNQESLNALQTAEVESFRAGELGYLPGSSYTYGDLEETAPAVFESLVVSPRLTDAEPNMYIESLVVNATSQNPDLARAFARFVTSSENQLGFAEAASVFPSSAGTLEDPYFTEDDGDGATDVRLQAAEQTREAVVWWPPAFSGSTDANVLREEIARAVLGEQSAQQALDASVAYSNERLAAQR